MKVRLRALLATVLVLGTAAVLFAQMKAGSNASVLSKAEALRLVRTIATAEAEKKNLENRGYASLQDLATPRFLSGYLGGKTQGAGLKLSGPDSATVGNYTLSIVVSPDGQHFQLSLVPASDCGDAFFTSDSFLIYEGKALDCPTG